MDEKTTDDPRAALRATLEAAGFNPTEATQMVDLIIAGWQTRDLGGLGRLVANLPPLTPADALGWMYTTVLIGQSQNGRELLFVLGYQMAARLGVTPELLQQLKRLQRNTPTSPPTSH